MSSNIQFESDNFNMQNREPSRERGLIGWLIRHKLANNARAAQGLLWVVFVLVIAAIIYVLK